MKFMFALLATIVLLGCGEYHGPANAEAFSIIPAVPQTIKTGSCVAGYTRTAPNQCMRTSPFQTFDPSMFTANVAAPGPATVNDTTVNHADLNGAKVAILRVQCRCAQDGTGEAAGFTGYIRTLVLGDQTQGEGRVCEVDCRLANYNVRQFQWIMVMLDANGDFEYEAGASAQGSGVSLAMDAWLEGYFD